MVGRAIICACCLFVQQHCEECDKFESYYTYESKDDFYDALTKGPNDCVLAAIRDKESYYSAKFAIPEGKFALTQGFLEIEEFLDNCHIEDHIVIGCDDHYNELDWENLEETNVPSEDDIWSDIDFPIPAGQLNLVLSWDGFLYPVASWNSSAFDGAVYECCPDIDDVCNVVDEDE
jgi:hypothetical protein